MIIHIYKKYIAILCAVVIAATAFIAAVRKDSSAETVKLPVIMYHLMTDNGSQLGKYVISTKQFESDMQYIKSKGYNTVTAKQLIDFADSGKKLPENPILITFDDGYESFYVYAFPLLKKLGMSAVLSVIGTYSETYSNSNDHNVNYSHCTWEQISEMSKSGFVDIGNHTWDMHTLGVRKGCAQEYGESDSAYSKALNEDVGKLQKKLSEVDGTAPVIFTYPYGRMCKNSYDVIDKMGFKITLGCEEKVNTLTAKQPSCLKKMRRFNRLHGQSSEAFFSAILKN